ncbi:uncharacterized protein F5147DRAFT_760081 [Suillus discolor]|uniref:F-box domain-containing protein n=1 Tax=Suillus discolor TaxID=1912936 RepID=A0A9P7F8V0_9AGAM|nr:uncharacterized protein F5147DRAFT_760081 [Suillus discolor]KAG2110870.1 hypothetical protein F5147DRAFT_760081 [Suillus discolor]
MHQALLVPEVLLDIFAHVNESVDLPSDDSSCERLLSQQSLASLATTCKTFYEPAMDLLWANIDELEPLLGCVTRLHPLIYCSGAEPSWSEGIEPLSEHEAHQFMRHAFRVRSIDISSDRNFHLLTVFPTETCIFPRLQSLLWQVEAPNNIYLHLFLSHTLLFFYLSAIHPALKSIGTHCTSLEALTIGDAKDLTPDESFLLSETIRSCTQLRHLGCPPLEWEAWNHLSNLPTLLKLEIGSGNWPLDRYDLKFAPFLNVTILNFYVHTASHTITTLECSEFPSLQQFEMHVQVMPFAQAEQLFRALSQCNAGHTLEYIVIFSFDSDGDSDEEPSDNSLTAITQFLHFTQLRTLGLVFENYPVYLDNDLLLKAMSSWPNIRYMTLANHQLRLPTITFRGLFDGLRLCPHLDSLQLHIDAINIDIDPETESFQHTSLQKFNVGFSNIEDVEAVARIIFFMLPGVEQVKHGYEDNKWDKVNQHLEHLRSSAALGHHT